MPKDYKRHLTHDMKGNFVEIEKETYKSKPREIDNTWIEPYWLLRDRVIYNEADEETKQAILKRYGKL